MAGHYGLGCERTIQNRILMTHALRVLGLKKQWRWLGIDVAEVMGKSGTHPRLRKTVLVELGRIPDEQLLTIAAAMVVTARPKTDRAAIRLLRDLRLQRNVNFSSAELAALLWGVLKRYRREHPGFSWPDSRPPSPRFRNSFLMSRSRNFNGGNPERPRHWSRVGETRKEVTCMEATDSQTPTIELADRLYITACPECGVAFALPVLLHMRRVQDRGMIHCPNGHANTLRPALATTADFALLHAQALSELFGLRRRMRIALVELDKLRPAAGEVPPPTKEEIVRRCHILGERGEATDYGRRLCRFCGKPSSRLQRHLREAHFQEVADLPASLFELP